MVNVILIIFSISIIYFLGNCVVNIGATEVDEKNSENDTINADPKILSRFEFAYELLSQLTQNGIDQKPGRVRTEEELQQKKEKNVILDFIGLVERRGNYTAEEYTLQSDDGYILKLHRISGSPDSPKADGKPAVLLQHCIFCTSDVYVEYGREQGLGLQLADNGYDVWLGNVRGNAYSRAHVKYSPDENPAEFWKFSHDEPALLDVPKFIDFVLEKTNQEKLTYIGLASGATLSYILLSGRPEYNSKINLVINLGPPVLFSRPISNTAELLVTQLPDSAEAAGLFEILPQSVLLQRFAEIFCDPTEAMNLCKIFSGLLTDSENIGHGVFPETLGYIPTATSNYVLKHYNQLTYANRKLMKFNWEKAGQNCTSLVCTENPEEYNLSLVTVPNALFYGDKDSFVKTSDVEALKKQLKNVVYSKTISKFNQLDFIFNKNVKAEVYDHVVEVMSKHL